MRLFSRKLKVLGLLISLMVISAATTGCQKSKKNTNSVPTPQSNEQIVNQLVAPGGDCPECLQQPEFLMAALGKYKGQDGQLELALDFYGEQQLGADRNNAASACAYSGPLVGIGNFHVVQSTTQHFCGLEPGKYTVHTSKFGNFVKGPGVGQMGGISGLTLLGQHEGSGRSVEIVLTNSIINGTCDIEAVRATGIDGSFRFALQNYIQISAVNGQPCGSNVFVDGSIL